MDFLYPHLLWLIVLLPLLASLKTVTKSNAGYEYSHLALLTQLPRSGRQQFLWLPDVLQLLALAALIVALAQPVSRVQFYRQQAQGIAIAMVVDVSSSMAISVQAGAKRETRMDVAKQVLQQFVLGDGESLKGRPNDLISVITFARYADTLVPLTSAHKTLAAMAQDIDVAMRPNEDGTAYGDATAQAAAQLSHFEQSIGIEADSIKSKLIILLTDGEYNSGDSPLMAAAMAKQWGIKIYTIKLGEALSAQASNDNGSTFVETSDMESADWLLQVMADTTGGKFQHAHDYQSLRKVYRAIDALETSKLQTLSFEQTTPNFQWPCILAMVFLLLASLLNAGWLRLQV